MGGRVEILGDFGVVEEVDEALLFFVGFVGDVLGLLRGWLRMNNGLDMLVVIGKSRMSIVRVFSRPYLLSLEARPETRVRLLKS